MNIRFAIALAPILAALLAGTPSAAATITSNALGDYNGRRYDTNGAIFHGYIGTLAFDIAPDAVITGAFFEGTYGTELMPHSTAGFDAVFDGYDVTACVHRDPGCWAGSDRARAFSIALPDTIWASLLDGASNLSLIQRGEGTIRLGGARLRIETADADGAPAPVPEPAGWAMMLLGFGAAGAAVRSRRKVAVAFG